MKDERQNIGYMSEADRERLSEVIAGEYGNILGVVVLKDGEAVYRRAFQGYDMRTPVHVASVTKSVLSALVGIAVEQGRIKSVRERVMSFFPDYECGDRNTVREEATVEELLNMTVPYRFAEWKEPLEDFTRSGDWVRFALEKIGGDGRRGAFQYSTEGAHLLSAILTRAVGKSAREYANEVLFGPAEMALVGSHLLTASEMNFDTLFGRELKGWANDPQGINTGGWGLTLTPDDMARFGLLYLDRGVWNGKRIIPETWMDASTAANRNRYAYLWWQLTFDGMAAFAAMGDGGNIICHIPRKRLVIAIASSFVPDPKDRCMLISRHILPYF